MLLKVNLINFDLDLSSKKNIRYLGGIDEVGRGCIAGPLVTAIVVYDVERLREIFLKEEFSKKISLIRDSKKLSQKNREDLSEFIKEICYFYQTNEVSNEEVDIKGISKSTNDSFFNNFSAAIKNKNLDKVLIDAFKIKNVDSSLQESIIRGDNTSFSIASASIIAKVYRDKLMENYSRLEEFKNYEFNENKGYGTKTHLENVGKFGPCNLHRKSFEPIKSMLKNQN